MPTRVCKTTLSLFVSTGWLPSCNPANSKEKISDLIQWNIFSYIICGAEHHRQKFFGQWKFPDLTALAAFRQSQAAYLLWLGNHHVKVYKAYAQCVRVCVSKRGREKRVRDNHINVHIQPTFHWHSSPKIFYTWPFFSPHFWHNSY